MILAITAVAAALSIATYTGLCGLLAQRFTRARRHRPMAAAAEGAERVQFAARDGRAHISAWYLGLPVASARGAVVFVHGKDACRGDELKAPTFELARAFRASGFAVLMIDLRGHGESSRARLTYGECERFDVLGAVDWLRARGHAQVGLLGASMGAASSLLAAADEPAVRAVVADSAFADFAQMIERQYRRLSHLPSFLLPGALALARALTGVRLERVRPLAAATALAGRPVLVIHSQGDRFIPADDARALAHEARAQLWITASHGHIGSYRAGPEAYTERVLGFFGQHLVAQA